VKSHVWRPLYVALGIVALLLILRMVLVPSDFGVSEQGYMYGWHRKSNEAEWQKISVKYKGSDSCKECHESNYETITSSPHADIGCENCHGPQGNHPEEPTALVIDRTRELCLRCHLKLPYKTSDRGNLKGISPEAHNPGSKCVLCHNPHDPGQMQQKQEVKNESS